MVDQAVIHIAHEAKPTVFGHICVFICLSGTNRLNCRDYPDYDRIRITTINFGGGLQSLTDCLALKCVKHGGVHKRIYLPK